MNHSIVVLCPSIQDYVFLSSWWDMSNAQNFAHTIWKGLYIRATKSYMWLVLIVKTGIVIVKGKWIKNNKVQLLLKQTNIKWN